MENGMKNKFAEENSIRTREIHSNSFLQSIMLCERHFSSSQMYQPHHRRKESSRVCFTRVWNPVLLKLGDLGCVNVLVLENPPPHVQTRCWRLPTSPRCKQAACLGWWRGRDRFPDLQFFIIEHAGKVNKQLLNVEVYGGAAFNDTSYG